MKRVIVICSVLGLLLAGKSYRLAEDDRIECGATFCLHNSPNNCCDDYNNDTPTCVESSRCDLKGNEIAWVVTVVCVLLLGIIITLFCLAKRRMYKDREAYFH